MRDCLRWDSELRFLLRTKLKALSFDSFVGPYVQDLNLALWKRTPRTITFKSTVGVLWKTTPGLTIYNSLYTGESPFLWAKDSKSRKAGGWRESGLKGTGRREDYTHPSRSVLEPLLDKKEMINSSHILVSGNGNPRDLLTEAIKVDINHKYIDKITLSLLASGFRKVPDNSKNYAAFLPCPLGTFTSSTSKGKQGCMECPPGGFYSDTLAHVGEGCKRCPNGSYVLYDQTPGKSVLDCKTCPEGTETDFFAGYRACQCLEGFYRTNMFAECQKCGQGGLLCQDDYASLKTGYWWQWRNDTYKQRYRDFIKNLLASSPALDEFSIQFPYPIPMPYRCQVEESCKGGLDSPCENGYEGSVCGVCSSGYYKQQHTCTQCPSKKLIAGQLSIIAAILLIIVALLVWKSKRNTDKKYRGRFLIDMFFSKLKIVIGFYQVTNGLVEAFSYIKWPGSLEVIAKYSGILQMNLLQITPAHCLFPGLHVDVFGELCLIMSINIAVIAVSGVVYGVRKLIISRHRSLGDKEKSKRISQAKELVYRNLFFFMFVTYLSTCSKTASVMPFTCWKLCRDDKEDLCNEYLKADNSIRCQGPKFNQLLIVAYISTAYILTLPVASFIALWRKRRLLSTSSDSEIGRSTEMITGLRFLFENYKARSWYWELVEMSRKVIITSGLILVGQESRSYIGLAWVVAGMYGMLFCWFKPIQDAFENRLMSTSLAVTVVNLGIGAVSRIPAENIPNPIDRYTDAVIMKILIVGANALVIGLIVVQYLVFLYQYIQEWRKNPHWSFSCCLALLLPLNDLQGEIRGMAGTNVLNTQLQTGEFEQPTIATAVNDSGALSVELSGGEGDHGDDNPNGLKRRNCKVAKFSKTKCDQKTQTELSTLSARLIEVQESFVGNHKRYPPGRSEQEKPSVEKEIAVSTKKNVNTANEAETVNK
ncbi:hypothetical protein ACROYT_G040389 [Oculina patagonica]